MQSLEAWLDYISAQNWQTIDMGLTRMQTMVERMDLQRPAPRIVTVAGTNGKGSTCLACESLLLEQGLAVGTTLSPHLRRFNERIRIAGAELGDADICAAFAAVEAQREDLPLTYFEFAALAALWCFRRARVDVAILEIGLGGRLDAFNVVDADVAVITSIGLDHEQFLGTTRAAIGAEKAGILRRDQHVVLGPDMPSTVLERCAALDLTPVSVDDAHAISVAPDGMSWRLHEGPEVIAADVPMGSCAPQNLLLAYLAVQRVKTVPAAALAEVAASLSIPGRMQCAHAHGRDWVLDVAHNPAGAEFLCRQLAERGLRPALLVCGMLRDKNHRDVIETLAGQLSAPWLFVGTQGERGMTAAALAARSPVAGKACATWQALLDEVDSASQPGDVILAFGSFNLIEQFDNEHGTPG